MNIIELVNMTNKITFLPSNIEAECASNENIFTVSARVGIDIDNICSGFGSCGLCDIKIIDGEECLNQLTKAEVNHLGNVYFINKKRLSCQVKFVKEGNVVIEVPKII